MSLSRHNVDVDELLKILDLFEEFGFSKVAQVEEVIRNAFEALAIFMFNLPTSVEVRDGLVSGFMGSTSSCCDDYWDELFVWLFESYVANKFDLDNNDLSAKVVESMKTESCPLDLYDVEPYGPGTCDAFCNNQFRFCWMVFYLKERV